MCLVSSHLCSLIDVKGFDVVQLWAVVSTMQHADIMTSSHRVSVLKKALCKIASLNVTS
jgi:hypothetical protein